MRLCIKCLLLIALLLPLTFPVSAQTPTPLPASSQQIAYGQTISATLTTTNATRDYTFSGHEGDAVVINLDAPGFESTLSLLDSSGSELATDSGSDYNPFVGPYSLPETASYTIRVTSFVDTVAQISLTLNQIDLLPLTYADSVEVAFTPDSRVQYFAFEGNVGDQVTLSVRGDSIETALSLSDPYAILGHGGDAGLDPTYTQWITKAGQYTLALEALTSANGVVTLTLERTPPPAIGDTPLTYSFINGGAPRIVAFTGTAGESVRLTLHSANGDADTFTLTVTQGSSTLVHRAVENQSDVTLTFGVPADGVVIVQLNQYEYTNVRFEVTLEHPAP